MIYLTLHHAPALLCGLHAVRTGRTQSWLWILIIGGSLGAAIYVLGVIVPELLGGRTARRVGDAAVKVLDPEREYRAAAMALPNLIALALLSGVVFALAKGKRDAGPDHP